MSVTEMISAGMLMIAGVIFVVILIGEGHHRLKQKREGKQKQ